MHFRFREPKKDPLKQWREQLFRELSRRMVAGGMHLPTARILSGQILDREASMVRYWYHEGLSISYAIDWLQGGHPKLSYRDQSEEEIEARRITKRR